MKRTLWTRDFTRITAATALGAAGGIISQFCSVFSTTFTTQRFCVAAEMTAR